MKFGSVLTSQAVGAVLAHSLYVQSGANATSYRIAKGTVLTAEHTKDLLADQQTDIVVARLENGDVEENEAATRLAAAVAPDAAQFGVRISAAGAGRVNLYSIEAGVVEIDEAAVMALNAVDPMITMATVPQFHRTDSNGMIATIKIIAYSVLQSSLSQAANVAANAIRIATPQYRTAALIETQVGDEMPSFKGRDAMRGRLDRFGVELLERTVVPHNEAAITTALSESEGEFVLLLTASATSDPMDVGPRALRQAGGKVTGFGMPVDPGNLLFFGQLDAKPVIGLPGCARSPALNGADWVLERLLCGISLSQGDIAAMGVGGLLKEIPTRPQPRARVQPRT
jgi:molybdenum cofactor cytidylyltransferase